MFYYFNAKSVYVNENYSISSEGIRVYYSKNGFKISSELVTKIKYGGILSRGVYFVTPCFCFIITL